ncbi:MAG: long-chain fatty acid--CoA ligase [Gemmatimonadaceae bacterium]|nr:long-chain fatty acid--CoA ligase [Gemmatimonadaceae bacterium]
MSETILTWFLDRAERHSDRVALRTARTTSGGTDGAMTWGEWRDASLRFSAAILSSEAADSAAVAILAGNDFVWPIADLGALSTGMTTVGLYPTSSRSQIEHMLRDCGAGAAVVDDPQQLEAILEMRTRLPALRMVISASTGPTTPGVEHWPEWLERGARELELNPSLIESIEARARVMAREAPAIIIYTSGSTGEPKGAVLSHGCIDASAESIERTLGLVESDSAISFLPFSHAAERIFGHYTRIRCGMEAVFVEEPGRVWEVASEVKPTVFGGMPRFFEKLDKLAKSSNGADPGRTRAGDLLGGRVRIATSGGAALPVGVAASLHDGGVTVLGAYGLTEHLCVAMNRPDDFCFDTVGLPMPGSEIAIADDGEVLVRRSELTFSGYHSQPAETRAAFTEDGEWVRTGDIGELDSRGRLRITGRKKELMVLSSGRKVAPLPIESRLAEHPWIAQAVLHAEGLQFVSALIALRRDLIEEWARDQGIAQPYAELVSHPQVVSEVQKAVDAVNGNLSRAESIRRFVVIDRELSVADSDLTPTHKVRRSVVLEKYSVQLNALYT